MQQNLNTYFFADLYTDIYALYFVLFALFFQKIKEKNIWKPRHLFLCRLVFACVVKREKQAILPKVKNAIWLILLGKYL